MARYTNHLTSHHSEHQSFPAHKRIPVSVLTYLRRTLLGPRTSSVSSKLLKRLHTRRARQYFKRDLREYPHG